MLGKSIEDYGLFKDLLMFSVEDSQRDKDKPVNKSYEFTWIDGLCAHGVSVKDLFYFQIKNLEKKFPLKIIIADKSRSPYYMLDTQTLSGEPLQLAAGKHKYYSIREAAKISFLVALPLRGGGVG